jgi:hypothetical protein
MSIARMAATGLSAFGFHPTLAVMPVSTRWNPRQFDETK